MSLLYPPITFSVATAGVVAMMLLTTSSSRSCGLFAAAFTVPSVSLPSRSSSSSSLRRRFALATTSSSSSSSSSSSPSWRGAPAAAVGTSLLLNSRHHLYGLNSNHPYHQQPWTSSSSYWRRRRTNTSQQYMSLSSSTTAATSSTSSASSSSVSSSSAQQGLPPRIKTARAVEPTGTAAVAISGWVRTLRKQKTLAFLQVNDGSNMAGIQGVLNLEDLSDSSTLKGELDKVTTGSAVTMSGPLVASQGGKQAVELKVETLRVIGECPADTYPLAKKRHTVEYMRTLAHLRPRTNTVAAVARVRNALASAIHQFYQNEGFLYVQTPLITASDCEGAGELFRVTTLNLDKIDDLPRPKPKKKKKKKGNDDEEGKDSGDDGAGNAAGGVDYSKDFFGKPAFLTVSGQLAAETHACALGDVYTFGPTFRAENSQTTRHLAEFHMVEPEMAFCDLEGAMDNAEKMLRFAVTRVLEGCSEDLDFFEKFFEKGLRRRLEELVDPQKPFARVPYRDAVEYLQEEIAKDPDKWQFPDVEFGTDLATEHERWLAETKFNKAVFVYDYPASIKAFYMRNNDQDDGETVRAMDLLVPAVGELIGGSQREERLDVLEDKIRAANLETADYWWYLDLRRFGSVPHSGYGLGFERLVCYVTGIDNIREAIAFPRTPGNAEF